MGKQTIFESIKEWLAGKCWKYFLRLNNLTEEEYFRQIKKQESRTDKSRPVEKLVMPQPKKYKLVIYNKDKINEEFTIENEPRYLLHIYMWFLIRDTPKYDIRYDVGRVTILRSEITKMRFVRLSA